jgi:hypothetical protein
VRGSGYSPDSEEINGYIAAECLLESLSDAFITVGLIEPVREGGFLYVIFGE